MSTHPLRTPNLLDIRRQRLPERPAKQGTTQTLADVLKAQANLVAWLVSLGFGGAMLVLYYSHIHYFPDLEWKESLTLLAALSFLGASIAILYGLLLYLPGVIWSEFLIHDSELQNRMCYRVDDGPVEVCYRSVGLNMALPFLLFMGIMHFVALEMDILITAVWAIGLLALISVFLSWSLLKKINGTTRKAAGERAVKEKKGTPEPGSPGSLLLKYVGLFDVSAALSLAALVFLYSIIDPNQETGWMLVICTAAVVVTNFLVAVQYRRRPGRAVLTAIIATLVLLRCGESESLVGKGTLSSRLMAEFGIGDHRVLTLVVKEEAITILRAHGIPTGREFGVSTVHNARILSRLGKDYFIEAGPEGARRRVAIPRDQVLSWSAPADR